MDLPFLMAGEHLLLYSNPVHPSVHLLTGVPGLSRWVGIVEHSICRKRREEQWTPSFHLHKKKLHDIEGELRRVDEGIVFSSKEGSASFAADDLPTTSVSFLLDESSTTESTPVKK